MSAQSPENLQSHINTLYAACGVPSTEHAEHQNHAHAGRLQDRYLMDIEPSYMLDPVVPARMKSIAPHAKLVVVLRVWPHLHARSMHMVPSD
jgi:hypothetical protein